MPKDPKPDKPNQCAEAWLALRSTHNRIANALSAHLVADCALSLSEFDAMLALHLNGGEATSMTEITQAVDLSQPALSRLIARLTERSLIERARNEADGRIVSLRLTESGQTLIAQAIGVHTEVVRDALDQHLRPKDQRRLLEILERINP
ncbi:MAG TPA: MarR family winged helix-turn-helix transcriptional regulator [Thermomicrobiales bacterium]|nr:MarR family winged helix-turn-helix transcriptional regulator [Thermomicrobiales bacterium]